nr:MAG TPA: Recombinase zinc beta ribbon domain [Caudoviricetes sp.]
MPYRGIICCSFCGCCLYNHSSASQGYSELYIYYRAIILIFKFFRPAEQKAVFRGCKTHSSKKRAVYRKNGITPVSGVLVARQTPI